MSQQGKTKLQNCNIGLWN